MPSGTIQGDSGTAKFDCSCQTKLVLVAGGYKVRDENKTTEQFTNCFQVLRQQIGKLKALENQDELVEEEVSKSRMRHRSLVEDAGAEIGIIDLSRKLALVNKAICRE